MDVEHDDPEPKPDGCRDCGVDRGTCDKCGRCIFCADKVERPRGGKFCRGCVDRLLQFTRDWREKWHGLAQAQGHIINSLIEEMES